MLTLHYMKQTVKFGDHTLSQKTRSDILNTHALEYCFWRLLTSNKIEYCNKLFNTCKHFQRRQLLSPDFKQKKHTYT